MVFPEFGNTFRRPSRSRLPELSGPDLILHGYVNVSPGVQQKKLIAERVFF
jgi:hypothetical protein